MIKIPEIFCGTDYRDLNNDTKAEDLIYEAVKTGFRGFDTAWMYRSELTISRALNRCYSEGVVKREDLFIQTKAPYNRLGYNCTLEAFEEQLKNLGTDYVDAYFVHHPLRNLENWEDLLIDTWRAMEKLYDEGKIKYLGISNFLTHHFDFLMSKARIKPSICQIQVHPQHQQTEMRKICEANDVVVEAWSPLFMGNLCSSPIINQIAKKYDKSAAQVILNWHKNRKIIPITKMESKEMIEQNLHSFDFKLDNNDLFVLDDMDHGDFEQIHTDNGIGFPVSKQKDIVISVFRLFGIPLVTKKILGNEKKVISFLNIPIITITKKKIQKKV